METRLRLLLVRAGLPRPQVQWVVQDEVAREAVWLDLAYPEHMIGIEYDGAEHPVRNACCATSAAAPDWWTRVGASTDTRSVEIYSEPDRIVSEVRRGLDRVSATSAW